MSVISQYQVVIPGQSITAALWNGMELNIINNGLIPGGIEDYSATDGQMQTMTDPYPASSISRPTSLAGELERIRWQLDNIIGGSNWYEDPPVDITTFKTRFDAHTHDGTSNNGPQIAAAGLASNSVTTAKIADSNVTTAKIADSNVTTAKIADANVTAAKIASSAIGNGLTGGSGTAIALSDSFVLSNRPIFHVYLGTTQSNVTGDGTTFKIPFNQNFINNGSIFDLSTNFQFTATVAGYYLLILVASVSLVDTSVSTFAVDLVTTSRTYTVNNGWENGKVNRQQLEIFHYFGVGQTAYINVRCTGGSKLVDVTANETIFCGALLF